ncbi:uncharacterized protein LOC122400425 [Colletes gigas]|uniref:uncharacterized protein LOC122400425 n=1 Tax=Colletes gigas TaxID=935657 RepID=UPI001C9B998C|nr:uncharacterized protein LOC122400425 [Colletes gigas]XP_043257820.1 uncharacterized protein LOC122400425 [Colletes gigas]
MMEEFCCDIVHALQNRDFDVLQKYYYNIREKIDAKVEEAIAYEIECREKRTLRVNKILELQQEFENLKSEIDMTKLQQKVVDKKILNAIKQQEKLQEEIDEQKSKRDRLVIEMIDLQQEAAKRKENKISTWDAIKRASYIYKQYLDFHIQLLDRKECVRIKVSFFVTNANTENKYFVHLCNFDGQWKVEQIQPALNSENLNDFKGIVDLVKNSEISDVTAFLCKLRHIFSKYYLNMK